MEGGTPNIPAGFRQIALFDISGAAFLPLIYWLVLAALLHIILRRTVFGKYVTAVGSNEKVSRIAGLNVKRIICLTYMLAGIMTAIAAVIQVSSTGALNYANAGSGYATDAIAACILGGSRLGGGRGYIAGAVLGTLIIAIINNIFGLLDISLYMGDACKGIIIIGAFLLQGKNLENAIYL